MLNFTVLPKTADEILQNELKFSTPYLTHPVAKNNFLEIA